LIVNAHPGRDSCNLIQFLLGYVVCSILEGVPVKISVEEEKLLKTWLEEDSKSEPEPHMIYMVALLDTILDRVLLVTETGKLGLRAPHTQIGDEVWVFHGGNVPFVLRPQTEWTHYFYNFVGDYIMEGIMLGELFEEGVLKEENGEKLIMR
jgi:hypothetical protein